MIGLHHTSLSSELLALASGDASRFGSATSTACSEPAALSTMARDAAAAAALLAPPNMTAAAACMRLSVSGPESGSGLGVLRVRLKYH